MILSISMQEILQKDYGYALNDCIVIKKFGDTIAKDTFPL